MHFIILANWHNKYTVIMLRFVKFISIYAHGIASIHTDMLTNKNVIKVLPPDLSVKYYAFIKASRGMHRATIHIKAVA